MCNEGEVLDKFGIEIHLISMTEFIAKVKKVKIEEKEKVQETIKYIKEVLEITVSEEIVENVASLKIAYSELIKEFGCSVVAIQCWNALQDELKIMPCMANTLMTDEGIPVVCKTDIHGAITSVIAQAAIMGQTPQFFADWTIVHPTNKNGELLQHCGCFPISLTKIYVNVFDILSG